MNPRASFTAADTMPIKLLQHPELIRSITEDKIIPPLHVQLIPTNKCNLNCSFCSCAAENRSEEMTWKQAEEIILLLQDMRTEGVTITGGGEPLLWPYLNQLIQKFSAVGIKTGLVTNGVLLAKQDTKALNKLTWCRVSQGDAREQWSQGFYTSLKKIVEETPDVDWAFSYVVSSKPNVPKIKELLTFAEEQGFTHIRLVADLLCPDQIPMGELQQTLSTIVKKMDVPVIFQERKQPEKGHNCRVCYLRPVIIPNMRVYACCGAQYALETPTKDFPPELCLGKVKHLPDIIAKSSKPFEGAKYCAHCYYGSYNRALAMLMMPVIHKEFI